MESKNQIISESVDMKKTKTASKKSKSNKVITEKLDTKAMMELISESKSSNEVSFIFNTSSDLSILFEKVAENPYISKTLKGFYNQFKNMRTSEPVDFKTVEQLTKEIVNFCKIVASVIVNAQYEHSNNGDVSNIQRFLRSAFYKNNGFISKYTKCKANFNGNKYCEIDLEPDFTFDKFEVYKINKDIGLSNILLMYPNILEKIHDKYYSYILLLAIILSLDGVKCLKLKEKKMTKKEKEEAEKNNANIPVVEEYKDLIQQLNDKFYAACNDSSNSTLHEFINFVKKEKAKTTTQPKAGGSKNQKGNLTYQNVSEINSTTIDDSDDSDDDQVVLATNVDDLEHLNNNSLSTL